MWTVHQPSSLGDVQCLSFICIKACELFFVDIGEHRKRLNRDIGAPMGGSAEIVFINHTQVRSLLLILIAFQAWEVLL